jgi:hypothetical protein
MPAGEKRCSIRKSGSGVTDEHIQKQVVTFFMDSLFQNKAENNKNGHDRTPQLKGCIDVIDDRHAESSLYLTDLSLSVYAFYRKLEGNLLQKEQKEWCYSVLLTN